MGCPPVRAPMVPMFSIEKPRSNKCRPRNRHADHRPSRFSVLSRPLERRNAPRGGVGQYPLGGLTRYMVASERPSNACAPRSARSRHALPPVFRGRAHSREAALHGTSRPILHEKLSCRDKELQIRTHALTILRDRGRQPAIMVAVAVA